MITFLGNGKNAHIYEDIIWRYRHERDVIVSCQYPYLIPKSIVNCCIPVVNIHYGLLPWYRGMNPVYWQMMTSREAGVTLHYVDETFDTGDIIATYSFPHYGHTADEVYEELESRGAWLLNEWISKIMDDNAPRRKQVGGRYYKKEDVEWDRANKVSSPFFPPEAIRQIFATHFEGKQYPEIEICGRMFELRAK